jgi:hypothetical protein
MRHLTVTAPGIGTCFRAGDVIVASSSRVKRLKQLLVKPRMRYVRRVVSSDTLEIIERRMTWAEWRAALATIILG